jgi:hypothetical protein
MKLFAPDPFLMKCPGPQQDVETDKISTVDSIVKICDSRNSLLVLPWRYAGIGKQLVGFVNAAT